MGSLPEYRRRTLIESHWLPERTAGLHDMTLGDALRAAAAAVPDRLALVEGRPDGDGRRWTYRALLDESMRYARALAARFRPGERVVFLADNIPEWVPMLYGTALAGLVLVTANPAFTPRELANVLERADAAGLFHIDGYRGQDWGAAVASLRSRFPGLREVVRIAAIDTFLNDAPDTAELPPVDPLDPCIIMFTSGTTGTQKGVMFHHKGVSNMAYLTHARCGLGEAGVWVNPMPMFYIGGLGHVGIGAVMHRATHVLASHWDAELFMRLVAREGGSYSLLVPTMVEAVLAHPRRADYDLSTLTNFTSGASVVEGQLIERIRDELGATICNIYGASEMQGVVTATHPDDAPEDLTGTIGQPIPHVELRIVDPDTGRTRPLDTQGEIWVRGYQTMPGYFGMPEETARTITPDGWLRSGDLATMDARGFVRICGRIKEMIIRGGQNIYPREIENLLLEHPGVAQVAVIGVPDPYWGEQVGAVVVGTAPDAPPTADDLHAFARANLAAFKTPALWYFVDALPHTDTGKVQKFRLVEAAKSGAMAAIRPAPREKATVVPARSSANA